MRHPAVWAGLGSLRSISPLAGSLIGVSELRHGCVKLEGPALALVLPLDPARARAVLEPVGLVPVVVDGVAWMSLSVEHHLLNHEHIYSEFYTTITGTRADGTSAELHHLFELSVTRDAGVVALWQLLWGHQFRLGLVDWSFPEADRDAVEPSVVSVTVGGQQVLSMRMAPRAAPALTLENHSGWFQFVPSGKRTAAYGRGWMEAWAHATPWDPARDELVLAGALRAWADEAGYLGTPLRWIRYPNLRGRTYFS